METRKVQKSGSSSFTVSLPADWVKAQKIRKNAPVFVGQNADGSLSVLAQAAPEKISAPMTLRVSGKEKKSVLFRRMVAAYIAGRQCIDVIPAPGQFALALELVSDYTSSTVSQEVVEETEHKISVKDVLNPAELPMGRVVQRMHAVCRKMVGAAVALGGGGSHAGPSMDILERDMDRLLWLAARKHHLFLRFPSMASAEGISLSESHLLFMTARYMERIADHALIVWKNGNETGRLRDIGKIAESQYCDASRAIFEKNEALAQQVIESVLAFKASAGSMKSGNITAAQVSSFASIRRMAEYSAGMCENLIDYTASQGQ